MSIKDVFFVAEKGGELWKFVRNHYPGVSRRTILEVAAAVAGVGFAGWLCWHLNAQNGALGTQIIALEAQNRALEEQLSEAGIFKDRVIDVLKIPVWNSTKFGLTAHELVQALKSATGENSEYAKAIKENYKTLNRESASLWMDAPVEIKAAIAPNPIPLLDLDYRNPLTATLQINDLTHRVYDCYGTNARLQSELNNWVNRADENQDLADQRYFHVIDGKDKVISCKDEKIAAVQACQAERIAAMQSWQADCKAEVQSCKDERNAAVKSLEADCKVKIQSCKNEEDSAAQSCQAERIAAMQFCKDERDLAAQSCKDEKNTAVQSLEADCKVKVQSCKDERDAAVQSCQADCKIEVQSRAIKANEEISAFAKQLEANEVAYNILLDACRKEKAEINTSCSEKIKAVRASYEDEKAQGWVSNIYTTISAFFSRFIPKRS